MPKTPLKLPYIPNREGDFVLGGRFGRSLTQLSKTAGCDLKLTVTVSRSWAAHPRNLKPKPLSQVA